MTTVIAIGECMVELRSRPDGAYTRAFAGDVFNAAVYLKRSAVEIDVRFLTCTGIDALSADMRAFWRNEGVDDELAFETANAIPGLYMVHLDAQGERSFTYWRSASAARRWFESLQANGGARRLAEADLIYYPGISLAILPDKQRADALALIATARLAGARIAFDPNYRAALWESPHAARQCLNDAMESADIVLPSRDDLTAVNLSPPAMAECVITEGAHGCTLAGSATPGALRAPAIDRGLVKDTSGAGDSFTGAYLAARLRGVAPMEAAGIALRVSARVVTAPGALVPSSISHPSEQSRS